MEIPEWMSPALFGAGTGAVVLAVVGFTWGGWVTELNARHMASAAVSKAVASSLTPYCLERSRGDPRSADILADMKIARGFQRPGIVVQAGWATPLGEDMPNQELANACAHALSALAAPADETGSSER